MLDLKWALREAHNADRHAVPELKWVSNGYHPVARFEHAGIAKRGRLKVGRWVLELDQGAVSQGVAAHSDRTISFPVVSEQADFDAFGSVVGVAIRMLDNVLIVTPWPLAAVVTT